MTDSTIRVVVHTYRGSEFEHGLARVLCGCGWVGFTTNDNADRYFREHAAGSLLDNGWPHATP